MSELQREADRAAAAAEEAGRAAERRQAETEHRVTQLKVGQRGGKKGGGGRAERQFGSGWNSSTRVVSLEKRTGRCGRLWARLVHRAAVALHMLNVGLSCSSAKPNACLCVATAALSSLDTSRHSTMVPLHHSQPVCCVTLHPALQEDNEALVHELESRPTVQENRWAALCRGRALSK